jgi:hypothetical protein
MYFCTLGWIKYVRGASFIPKKRYTLIKERGNLFEVTRQMIIIELKMPITPKGTCVLFNIDVETGADDLPPL